MAMAYVHDQYFRLFLMYEELLKIIDTRSLMTR